MAADGIPREKRYLLRRTLCPWKFQETIEEAREYAREFGVDEIIWKIDTEEFTHGLPTLERIGTYLPWLEKSRKQLAEIGVSMSINPWVTQGMRDAGLNNRDTHPEFEWMTDLSGLQANAIACPLSPAWRKWLRDAYLLYASTRPRVLWIEDDIRVHRHRPVIWACFCERHLREFGGRVGRNLTREELVAEVLRPGAPSEIRKAWLEFEGDGILGAIQGVANAVYERFPETHLGLMCNAPWSSAMEWRDWDAVLDAVRGPHKFVTIRPSMENYQEPAPTGLYNSWGLVSGTLACVRRPVHACTEIENWPFTRFSKSIRFTRAQLLLSAALGCPSMTLNLYDHVGTPLFDEPQYGVMLKAARARLDALVEAHRPGGVARGFQFLNIEDGGKQKRLKPGAEYGDLSMGCESWAVPLMALGLSGTYAASPVLAISGQALDACEGRLEDIFRRSVLLDLSAVETLVRMEREDLIGLSLEEVFERRDRATPAEEPLDAEFGGAGRRYMTADHLGLIVRIGRYEPQHGARTISRLVDPDRGPVQPGFVLYENALGGRVAVCPYDMCTYGAKQWFLNWHRKRQFEGIARWLFRGAVPLTVAGGTYAVPMRTDYPDCALVSVLNLAMDDWPEVAMTLSGVPPSAKAEILRPDGDWQPLPPSAIQRTGGDLALTVREPLPTFDMMTVRLGWR